MANHDDFKNPKPHAAPAKTVVDKVVELALSAGGGVVSLMSGLLAAVLILYSGYVLYDTFSIERQASSSAWDLLQYRPEILENEEVPLAASDLAAINKNYRGWLTVYNTAIDYPVVQGPDDLYYASHNIYNEVSLTGAIYLAAGNSGDFSDSYNVIYGHHMDNGAMFGGLDRMTGSETGVIITQDAVYDVEFFAVVTTDAYESRIYSVGNRMDSVLDFLRSGGKGGVGVGTKVLYFNESAASDAVKLVALSTCTDAVTSGRLVVIGKMIRRQLYEEYTLTIYYRTLDGKEVFPMYWQKLREGDPYDVESPVLAGYRAILLRVTGNMPARNVEVTVLYVPEGTKVIEKFESPLGVGKTVLNKGDCLE